MPLPERLSRGSRHLKMPNTFSAYCGSIPIPLSRTENSQSRPLLVGGDVNTGTSPGSILNRIHQQILEKSCHLDRIAHDRGQSSSRDDCAAFLDQRMKVPNHIVQRLRRNSCSRRNPHLWRPPVRKSSRSWISLSMRSRAFHDEADELIGIALETAPGNACSEAERNRHRSERLPQIVIGDIRKLLQLFVRTHQAR